MSTASEREAAFVAAFIQAAKQPRSLSQLSNPKSRQKFLSRLAHFPDFDVRWLVAIPTSEQFPTDIEQKLRANGAPADCYIISESAELDGRVLPLGDALSAVVGCQLGAILSCVHGRLAFYEGEGRNVRFILQRP